MENAMTKEAAPVVSIYDFKASNGRHARKAMKVTFPNGRVVHFMETLSKREAVRQATAALALHPEYFTVGA